MNWDPTTDWAEPVNSRPGQGRRRNSQRPAKETANLSDLEESRHEVEVNENKIKLVLSLHKEQSCRINWLSIQQAPAPVEPSPTHSHQRRVEARQASHAPTFLDRLLGRAAKKAEAFESEAREAKARDEQEFQAAWNHHLQAHAQWMHEKELAAGVLSGDHQAYVLAIQEFSPFGVLAGQGSSISFRIHSPKLLEVMVGVNGQQAIPSEIKTLRIAPKVLLPGRKVGGDEERSLRQKCLLPSAAWTST